MSQECSQKRLFKKIMSSVAADVVNIPFADRHSDQDHQQFFMADGIGRDYLMDSLNDTASPVFALFDKDALMQALS